MLLRVLRAGGRVGVRVRVPEGPAALVDALALHLPEDHLHLSSRSAQKLGLRVLEECFEVSW